MAVEEQALRCSCMDIQCNWSETAATKEGKVWVSCRRPSSQTVHGHVIKKEGKFLSTDDKFTVTDSTPNSVTVQCNYSDEGCATTFIRPLKTFHLHKKKIICMDVSESGGLGVCASEDGKTWVWDPDTGETRRDLEGHVMDVEVCRFFPSGVVVLTGGADMRLKIWSAQDGSCPRTLAGHTGGITDTAIIDRGRNIVSVSRDGTARLWDCGTGQCLTVLTSLKQSINSCSITSSETVAQRNPDPPLDKNNEMFIHCLIPEPECGTNDKLLALACGDGFIRGLDIRSRKSVFQYCCCETGSLSSCEFSSEFELVCGGEGGLLAQLDIRMTTQPLMLFHSTSAVTSLASASEQSCLAGYANGSVILWRLDNPLAPVSKLTGPDIDHVTSICLCGNSIFTSCRDGHVRVYSTHHLPS